jgi:hypothetical protein
MKAAKAGSVPRTGPHVRASAKEPSRLQARILSNLGRSRRYLHMLLWIFVWAARESPALLVMALISDIIARASIMAAFIGLVKAISFVANVKERAALIHHLAVHHIPMRPGVLVLAIALLLASTFLVSAIAVSLKRRWYEKLGARVSTLAHQFLVRQFQLELQSLAPEERRPAYLRYIRFEDPIITALKNGAANSVELFAVFVLLAYTVVYLAVMDYRFLIFMLCVVASFGVFSVGFSYREHLIGSRERQARSQELNQKVNGLVADFIDDDQQKRETARETLHLLKLESVINTENQNRPKRKGNHLVAKLLGFLSDPANTQIVISTPVFIFIVFYAYYESFVQEVTLTSIFTILFVARFMLQFSQALVGEARKFSIKYRNIRIYYMISVMGRRLLPFMDDNKGKLSNNTNEEEDDENMP